MGEGHAEPISLIRVVEGETIEIPYYTMNRVDSRDLFIFVEWSASHLNQSKYSTPPSDAVEA
jgi:hypothetical protein